MNGAGSSAAFAAIETRSADLTRSMGACGTSISQVAADDLCQTEVTRPFTPEAREAAIARAGAAMEAAYAVYLRTWNEADLDRAYAHLNQMRSLVKGRSAETVRRMEQERGIA